MRFETIAELPASAGRSGVVYAEGWQSWSPIQMLRLGDTSPRAPDENSQTTGWRPGKPVPAGAIQAEGVLAVVSDDGSARAWFAPQPDREVATLRLEFAGGSFVLSADGAVEELQSADLAGALAAVGDRFGAPPMRRIPPGWCSWSCYFSHVTEDDVVDNVEAALRLDLPIEIALVDGGPAAAIGDWLDARPGFGSLRRLAERIVDTGLEPGVWTAPFLISPASALARAHPDWLVKGADAGVHWDQRMRILDVTHPAAAEHLTEVYRTLSDWGFSYYKLDFLYAGAIDGRRHGDATAIEAYRAGMQLIRHAVGQDAILLACGAPLLPSIGLCDAMRIGPDVLPESPDEQPDLHSLIRITGIRSWMNGRLWVNDPDCLVARPEIVERDALAAHLVGYAGVAFSGDRLAALDEHGLELTRRVLESARPG